MNIKYSNLKIFWHQDKINDIAEGNLTPPVYIRIKPTNICNHNCFYCSYQNDKRLITTEDLKVKDSIPENKMKEILEDLNNMGVRAVTYSGGGEPLIYPYINETMQKTLDYGINLSIITNGQMLKNKSAEILSNAHWVRISLDSGTKETFAKIRQVDEILFEELLVNIEEFSKIKNKKCELGINFVINHLNYKEIYDAAKLFKDLGVNHVKFTARNTPDFDDYHEPFKENALKQIHDSADKLNSEGFNVYNSYENDFIYAGVYERKYEKCPIVQVVTIIAADSNVYLCHDKTYSESGRIGSIREQGFKNLWESKETKELLLGFNAKENCKHHCTYDVRNMMINEILDCRDGDVNYV